jgi:2-polyprenyl-6-hydroxyphenyl methylase/3-demethylubiquinone-9 3-methyltransferase
LGDVWQMASSRRPVNNAIYSQLGERWYRAHDDPVALLRAESKLRAPWVEDHLRRAFPRTCDVLDVGCGAGFLANHLARAGHRVVGLDLAAQSLAVGRRHDRTGRVQWQLGDAARLPFRDESFDAVCAMDVLEHVELPARIVSASARVLATGGLLFFNTYNRNWLAWLVAIKGVEWFVRNTPHDMHVLRLFIRPSELTAMCEEAGLELIELVGTRPRVGRAMMQILLTGIVPEDFAFTFTSSTRLGYAGIARKLAPRHPTPRRRSRSARATPTIRAAGPRWLRSRPQR